MALHSNRRSFLTTRIGVTLPLHQPLGLDLMQRDVPSLFRETDFEDIHILIGTVRSSSISANNLDEYDLNPDDRLTSVYASIAPPVN